LDIEPLIKALAAEDMRSIGNELALLVRKVISPAILRRCGAETLIAAKANKAHKQEFLPNAY
jgi:hypothetical protein